MTEFIVDEIGPNGLAGVFEDDGETGYLYIFEPDGRGIITHLHVYDRSEKVNVQESDVRVVWSSDGTKCGVIIWNGIRGIIDVAKNLEGRAWLEDQHTLPITDEEWLRGF